jgi:hypothetical protein
MPNTPEDAILNKVKLLRFRAWLECGDWEQKGGKIEWKPKAAKDNPRFPITSCEISVSLNAIPIATVTIAAGRCLKNEPGEPKTSPIHSKEGAEWLLSMPNMTAVKIIFRPLTGDKKEHVIFTGFIQQPSQSFTYSNTEITLTLVHWLFALDANPVITESLHPSSIPSYTQSLLSSLELSGTGANRSVTRKAITQLGVAHTYVTMGQANVTQDIMNEGILPVLRELSQIAITYSPWSDDVNRKLLKPALPITADDILNSKVIFDSNSGNSIPLRVFGGHTNSEFQNLPWTDEIKAAKIEEWILSKWLETDYKTLYANSVWASLLHYAAQFSFMLVPRVHELRFIPKWFTSTIKKVEDVKELTGATVVNATWEYARPICGVIICRTREIKSEAGENVGNQQNGQSGNTQPVLSVLESKFGDMYYGVYKPPDNLRNFNGNGTLLVREAPAWADLTSVVDTSKTSNSMNQQSASKQKPEPEPFETFANLLAEEAYWDESFGGRIMEVICPLRFDIIPGSTVRVSSRVGTDIRSRGRAGNKGTDSLEVTYVGFVKRMSLTFDTINATAASNYTLTHVRNASVESKAIVQTRHPYFKVDKPFSHASWTADECKTID